MIATHSSRLPRSTQPDRVSARTLGIDFLSVCLLVPIALAMMLLLPRIVLAQDDPPYLPAPVHAVSTVPANGDGNPYGVAFVPDGFPNSTVNPGDILVSNFNNAQNKAGTGNLQGTGRTIVRIPIEGTQSLFFKGKKGLGLTTP